MPQPLSTFDGVARDLLFGLDADQAAAVSHPSARLRVLAAPGSGKTRVLTRRAAWRVAEGTAPTRLLIATFTRRAAAELEARLRPLGVDGAAVGTFHGLASRQLRQRADDQRRARPRVLTDPGRALDDLEPSLRGGARLAVLGELAWAGARRLDPAGYVVAAEEGGRRPPLGIERSAALLERYAEWKGKRGVLDFDDLLAAWVAALLDDPEFGRAQRWRFREVLVDEFQDVNPGQLAVVEALLDDETRLTVVGDPDQAIYGWNGAEDALLRELPDRLDGVDTVELGTSYRCPRPIAAAAAGVLDRPCPSTVRDGAEPELHEFTDELAERDGIVSLVSAARASGSDHAEIAVLARTRQLADELAAALIGAGVAVAEGDEATGVTVTTFHAAKGLEWDDVILAGVEDGLVPHRNAVLPPQLAEERRLLYVAMTRSGARLHVTWTAERSLRDGVVRTGASEWIGHLRGAPVPIAEAPWQVELDRCRSSLSRSMPAGARRRREAVLAWRTTVAATARCLPEAVVDDGTVRSLAADPPGSIDELAARTGWGPAALDRHGTELARALGVPAA